MFVLLTCNIKRIYMPSSKQLWMKIVCVSNVLRCTQGQLHDQNKERNSDYNKVRRIIILLLQETSNKCYSNVSNVAVDISVNTCITLWLSVWLMASVLLLQELVLTERQVLVALWSIRSQFFRGEGS